MSKVVIDATTRAKLAAQTGRVELYDEAGELVGYYEPPRHWSFTDAELAAADRQTGGRPLKDIWKDLGRS